MFKSPFWTSFQHTVISGFVLLIPIAYNMAYTKWGDITVGAILTLGYHWLNAKFNLPAQPMGAASAIPQTPATQSLLNDIETALDAIMAFVRKNPLVAILALASIVFFAFFPSLAIIAIIVIVIVAIIHR
jgi:hypothetical protein